MIRVAFYSTLYMTIKQNSKLPKVSVLIVTYNQLDFISEAIESVLEQDYQNLELVIADDSSTDGSIKVVQQFQALYPDKIKTVIGTKNLGITGNCNQGLKKCTGEYIAFLGGDDLFFSKSKITEQVKWMEEDSSRALCGHDAIEFDSDTGIELFKHSKVKKLQSGVGARDFIANGLIFAGSTIMVRKNVIPEHLFLEVIKLSSDHLFFIECLGTDHKYGYVPNIFSKRRRHSRNITNGSTSLEVYKDLLMSFGYLDIYYPQYSNEIERKRIDIKYVIGLHYLKYGDISKARLFLWIACNNGGLYSIKYVLAFILSLMPKIIINWGMSRRLHKH